MPNPLATARQLWRLNKDGALALNQGGMDYLAGPITSADADAAIKRETERAEALALEADGGIVEYHGT